MHAPLLKITSIILLLAMGSVSLHAAAPRNDTQSEAFSIFEACYVVGDNSEASHEVNERNHAAAGGSKSLWWTWSPSGDGEAIFTVRSYGNNAQFVLSAYRSGESGELVEVGQINPLSESGQDFTTQFEVESGESYFLAIDSPRGSVGGRFYLGLNQAPEFLTPLQVRVPTDGAFEIPINIAGAPDEVELWNAPESVAYDSVSKILRGTVPNDSRDSDYDTIPVTLRAQNAFGECIVDVVLVPEREELIYTGAASAVGFVGVPFEYVLSFDGGPSLTSQDIQAWQLPQGFYLAKEAGQWKIKGLTDQWYSTDMRIDIQIPEGKALYLEIPLLIVELADAQLQPAVISPLMVRGVVGQPFSYQIEMSLPSVNYFSASSLPAGLTLNEQTGLISGTLEYYGDEAVLLSANFDYPPYETQAKLFVQILEESEFPPVIQSPPTAVAWVGVPFEYQIEATNGVDDYFTYSSLPEGLALNEETGLISGTPEWAQADEELRIVTHNQRGSAEAIVTLDILEPDRIAHVTSPAQVSVVKGEFFEYQIESNLEAYDSYEMSAYLPQGMEYDEANSRIFGVPQQFGDETVELQFFDNNISVQLRVVDNDQPVEFLNAATAVGRVGSFFYFAMNAKGAVDFDVFGGGIPGLAFDDHDGVFTGLPTVAGTYELKVIGRSAHGEPTHAELKIVILEETEVVPPSIILSPGQLLAEVGETFAYSIASSKYGAGNFDVSYLPDGVSFDQASGTLFGAVDQAGHWVVEISAGATSADLHLHFYEPAERPLLVTSAPSAVGQTGEFFEYQIETNVVGMDAQNLYFYEGVNFPESLSLDESTGLISGYLAEELPVNFEVHVDVAGGFSELKFTIVDGSTGVPAQVVSPAHIVAYPNEAFEYQFVFDQPGVIFDVVDLEEGLSYHAGTQTLSGAMTYEGEHWIDFKRYEQSSDSWFSGQLTLEVRNSQDRPDPLMISAAGPVANRGEFFSYDVEFDRVGIEWSVDHAPEWLAQSGDQLVGYVPEDQSNWPEEAYLTYFNESEGYWHNARLTLNYNSPEWPVAVVSSASAHATIGLEFSYQIEVAGAYDGIEVGLPAWASYDPVLMRVTGVPDTRGVEVFYIWVSRSGSSIEAQVQVVVEDAWQPAIVTSLQPSPVFEGISYQYELHINGAFESLYFYGPDWLEIDADTLIMSGIPENSGDGDFQMQLLNEIADTDVFVRYSAPREVAPYILEELQDLVIYPGGKAYFSPLTTAGYHYEWFKNGVSLGWMGDWLQIDEVTVADQGIYSARVINEYAEAWTLPTELQIGQPAAYRDWLIAHFGWEVDGPYFAESNRSFAGDTTPDLMKWAFGVDPTTVVSAPLSESSMAGGGFQIQFQRSVAPRDIRIVVERSGTLAADDWSAIAILPPEGSWQALRSDVTVDETGSGELRSVTVIDAGDFTQYFVRVRIELVAED